MLQKLARWGLNIKTKSWAGTEVERVSGCLWLHVHSGPALLQVLPLLWGFTIALRFYHCSQVLPLLSGFAIALRLCHCSQVLPLLSGFTTALCNHCCFPSSVRGRLRGFPSVPPGLWVTAAGCTSRKPWHWEMEGKSCAKACRDRKYE